MDHPFELQGTRTRRWPAWIGALVLVAAGCTAAAMVWQLRDAALPAAPIVALVGVAGWWLLWGFGLRPVNATLRIDTHRIVLDDGRAIIATDTNAPRVALWMEPNHPTPSGVVVTIGAGRGCRIAFRGAPEDAVNGFDAVRHVDIVVSGDDFGTCRDIWHISDVSSNREIRAWLWPNTQRASGVLAMMLPWFATIGLLVLIGVVLGPLGLAEHLGTGPWQQGLPMVVVCVIAVGLGWTMRRNMRVPRPSHRLRITDDWLSVVRRDGRVVIDQALAPGIWAPYRHLAPHGPRGLGGIVTLAGLRLNPARGAPLKLGARVPDRRFPSGVSLGTEPTLVMAPESWQQLVSRLARAAPPPGVRIGEPPPRASDSLVGPPFRTL